MTDNEQSVKLWILFRPPTKKFLQKNINIWNTKRKRLSFFNEDTQNTVLHNSLCPSENKLSKSREESLSNWVVFQTIFSFYQNLLKCNSVATYIFDYLID